jgi:DNA-binding SARP family transcriptional activator
MAGLWPPVLTVTSSRRTERLPFPNHQNVGADWGNFSRVTRLTFHVLGRVSVQHDGVEQDLRGRRERAVLAVLLAQRGQVVSAERLVDEVWGGRPPASARASLQVAVSRLRTVLEPERSAGAAPTVLVSSGNGYSLRVGPEELDAGRFDLLAERAHTLLGAGEAGGALQACDEALALWAGTPYAEVTESDLVQADANRLRELHWALFEARAEAMLALGRAPLVIGELETLLAEHPFRERAWHLLAVALYRSGRQADALAAVRRARDALVDELGVDLSPELQRLEADLLAQAQSLDGPVASTLRPRLQATEAGGQVGREDVLATLRGQTAQLLAGTGSTMVVTGEAGIGKTRLVLTAAEEAELLGVRVLWGRCHEADVSPAYWPWVPVVRELAGHHPSPEVAALLTTETVGAKTDASSAALRTYDAVCRLLAESANERPLVVIVEDLHWADTASLQLLAYAAEALRSASVLLLATVRIPEEAPAGLQACLASLARVSARRLHLEGLPPGQVHTLVAALAGTSVADELGEVVADRTDGNPFFVIELVRLLEADGTLTPEAARDVAVPHGVEDVLRLRMARLPEGLRSLLAFASVGGREFRLEQVATVAGVETDAALELLDLAVEARIVEEHDVAGRYRFVHALVRETLYAGLSRTRRGRLHGSWGELLERHLTAEPDLTADVAHHLSLGTVLRPELAAGAITHAVSAARLAEGRGAFDRARTHWEQAVVADNLSLEPDERRRFELLLGLGRACYRTGDVVGARAALDEAVALGARLGDVDLVADAATSFRGSGVWHWREFGTSDPGMIATLEDCLAQLEPGPLQAKVLASLSMEMTYEWRVIEAESYSARAVEVARRVRDHDLLASVIGLRELLLFGRPGAAAERISLADELLALPLSLEQELHARFGATMGCLQSGDPHAADRQMARCVELARRLRHTGVDVPIAWFLYYRALAREDPAAAVLGERATQAHIRSSLVGLSELRALASLRSAGFGSPVPDAIVQLAHGHSNTIFRNVVAHALVESGSGLAVALELLGDPVPPGAWHYASMYGECMQLEVLAEVGDTQKLREVLRRVEPWQHEFVSYGSNDCAGSVAYFVGRAREALGDLAEAEAAYCLAVEANQRGGILPWLRRAEKRLAGLR